MRSAPHLLAVSAPCVFSWGRGLKERPKGLGEIEPVPTGGLAALQGHHKMAGLSQPAWEPDPVPNVSVGRHVQTYELWEAVTFGIHLVLS